MKNWIFRFTRWRIVQLWICVSCAYFTICKTVFNLSTICKIKKCLFRSTRWRIVPLSICVIYANFKGWKTVFNLSTICKMKKCLFRPTRWSTVINFCNLCKLHHLKDLFKFEYKLQIEEMFFQIYSFEDRTIINFCNLRNIHHLQDGFQVENNLQNEEMHFLRFTRLRIVP